MAALMFAFGSSHSIGTKMEGNHFPTFPPSVLGLNWSAQGMFLLYFMYGCGQFSSLSN